MRKICLVLLLLICANAKAAGDRSGIEPVGKSTASFLPPITPPLSGSPGNNKYLQLGRADISLTRVGQPGLYRVVRVVTPQSAGAWSGRLTGFEW